MTLILHDALYFQVKNTVYPDYLQNTGERLATFLFYVSVNGIGLYMYLISNQCYFVNISKKCIR